MRKWEAGDRRVPGPVWVALRYMLEEAGARDLEAELAREAGVIKAAHL